MKIEKVNAGHLTNFEVLDFLRTRGATTDPMGCLGAVAASECKVYEYLLKTPARNQTREQVTEFKDRCGDFKLTDADKQNIINCKPSAPACVFAMVEDCGSRFSRDERGEKCNDVERAQERAEARAQELLDLFNEVFPRRETTKPKDEEMKDDA